MTSPIYRSYMMQMSHTLLLHMILFAVFLVACIGGTQICYDENVKPLGYCPTKWQCCAGTQWCCPVDTLCHVQKNVKCVKHSLIYNPFLLSLAVIIFLFIFGFKRVSDGKRKKPTNSSDTSTREGYRILEQDISATSSAKV